MPTYQPATILIDRYRIEQFVGAGAFAEVYLATHLALNARYALKILRKDASIGSTIYADYVQRFRLEAQLGAALKSPYIVQVHDFEELDDLLILRMDYAPGGSLQQRLDAVRRKLAPPISIDEAVRIAREVALGLAALHELDAVHRDVKPSNILFAEDGRAMLADLGLAQVPGGPSRRSILSEPMPHPGTPMYMSPEQARPPFPHLTPPSDIFSLGAVLFEMLTGRLYKNVRPGTPVTKYRPDTPDWLVNLLSRMLADDPRRRPWDGAEVAALLLEGETRAREEAAARKRAEEERKRREKEAAERRKREAEEKKRREQEAARKREEERQRQEKEAAERRKREEKKRREREAARKREAERKRKEKEKEAERKRRQRQTAERARREAEEKARREEERQRREKEAIKRTIRHLSPWNPLDYVRLAWWILAKPQMLRIYTTAYGREDLMRMSYWFDNALHTTPLLMVILAIILHIIPIIFPLAQPSKLPLVMLLDKVLFFSVILAFIILGITENSTIISKILIIIISVGGGILILYNGLATVIIAMVVILVYAARHVDLSEEDKYRWSPKPKYPVLDVMKGDDKGKWFWVLIYLFVLWYCFLGGWQVFLRFMVYLVDVNFIDWPISG